MKSSPANTALILTGSGYNIEIAADAVAQKTALLAKTAGITQVESHEQSETARAAAGEIAKVRIAVEKARKEIKAPVLDVGKRIDATASDYMKELEDAEKRLTNLVGDYARKVEAERRAALQKALEEERERERVRMLEEARAKQAALDAEMTLRKAEAASKAAEEALFEGDVEEDEFAAVARAEREAEELAAKANAEAQAIVMREPEPLAAAIMAPAPPKGVTYELDYEVTNLAELYQAAPSLVQLTACRSAILAAIKQQRDTGKKIGFPGLRVIEKPKVSVR